MGRSIGAVVVGFLYALASVWLAQMLLWFCLGPEEPDEAAAEAPAASLLALKVVVALVSAGLAGFMAAHVAGRDELAHGLALGAILVTGLGLITLVVQPEPAPLWYQLTLPAVTLPGALVGAHLRALMRRRPPPPPKTP